VCGDASADRGSGAVPAFLAAELGARQALGLVAVTTAAGDLRATRRLDGGRREVLDVSPPAVLSVEGGVARLRRATLAAELAARTATVEEIDGPRGPIEAAELARPYRPRARALAAPSGAALDRVRRLTDAGRQRTAHELVTLDPAAAAKRILDALRDWNHR
jgi:electron transfer flavoprotein beta subunit